ncbi:family 20 glycosylhydrolase [Paenibacillus tritici]|uniref:beta-N-acetylhexosaminidase n=1 Tax=Paenibacillus tritici TaxID=1873425 RepID=UPI001BA5864D|nr:family 20 glycosylhydrolase [Paenibacillus tritici]QUL55869.1 family 20 glycosylhydrolase [Paenibacillus tritici]
MPEVVHLQLLPRPQKVMVSEGLFHIPAKGSIVLTGEARMSALPAARRLQQTASEVIRLRPPVSIGLRPATVPAFIFSYNALLTEGAYELHVNEAGITAAYGSPQGAYYAAATLKQLLVQYGRTVPYLHIQDQPDFAARGLMLDISRNKIPKLETLYRIIDLMSDLKLNQLQLYIEGAPFAYESFPQVWELETPITGEEILLLDAYCRERYIELVPNQNSFGHMEGWLTRPEFNSLAEAPDGFMLPDHMYNSDLYPDGLFMHPGTFDTEDPEVLKLLGTMYDDLLPYFTSDIFNVGCDETYEVGLGKNKALAETSGKGELYLSFLQKIQDLVKQRGKTMQFWGDIIIQYPELIPRLPKDMIAMEWGYGDTHPFEADTLKFREAGIPFYVCPGTSSWNSLTGRTDNMLANLRNAAVHGKRNGALGYLITDWGDFGHWQHLPVSYAGFVYGAALAWNVEGNLEADVAQYLNTAIFRDRSGTIGQLLLDLGNYYKLESGTLHPNDTEMSMLLRSNLENVRLSGKLSGEQLDQLEEYVGSLEARLEPLALECDDAGLVVEELNSGIHFVKHAVKLTRLKHQLAGDPPQLDAALIQEQIHDLDLLLHQYRQLWTQRNRLGGLEQSVSKLVRLRGEYAALAAKLSGAAVE